MTIWRFIITVIIINLIITISTSLILVAGVVPRNGLTGVKCLMLSRVDGTCNSYSEQESSFNFGDSSVCLDPLYNVLWW